MTSDVASAALLVPELDVHLTAWEAVKDDRWALTACALAYTSKE